MRTLILFSLAAFCAAALPCGAAELEHLGSPPPGAAFGELSTDGSLAPVQLMGTVNPPTAVVDGNPLKLSATATGGAMSAPGPALWVNGEKREVSGGNGRFFFQLSPEESVSSKLEISMCLGTPSEPKCWGVATALNRIFLEGAIHQKITLDPEKAAKDSLEFVLKGALPAGVVLTLEDGRSFSGAAVEIPLKLAVGSSVILGRVSRPDGTVRPLSVPVRVRREDYDSSRAILSVEAPGGKPVPGAEPWRVPMRGAELRGVTNPGASLSLNGHDISVGSDGAFRARLNPTGERWIAEFRVTPRGRQTAVFRRAALTEDFVATGTGAEAGAQVEASTPANGRKWTLLHFRAGTFDLLQSGGGASYTGALSWDPSRALTDWLSFRPHLGVALPNGQGTGVFVALLYGARISFDQIPLWHGLGVELGGGGESWISHGGTFGYVEGLVRWNWSQPRLFGLIDEIWAGDTLGFAPVSSVHQLQIGVGISL